jgi:hypothetical protein
MKTSGGGCMSQDEHRAMQHGIIGPGPRAAVVAPDGDGAATHRDRRRSSGDRRERVFWSLFYGGVRPRRRRGRRDADHHRPLVDWHGEGLLTSSIVVLLLCVADALLTLQLLTDGATEVNPLMALLVARGALGFALVKLSLTGAGVLALVSIARFRVFRQLRAAMFVHAVLFGYAVLVAYELWLVNRIA